VEVKRFIWDKPYQSSIDGLQGADNRSTLNGGVLGDATAFYKDR